MESHVSTSFSTATPGISTPQSTSAIAYHRLSWIPQGVVSAAAVQLEQSIDAAFTSPIVRGLSNTATASGVGAIVGPAVANFTRINVTTLTGGGSLLVVYTGFVTNPNPTTTKTSSSFTTQSAALPATTLYAVPAGAGGLYRIGFSANVTQAATISCLLGGATGFQVIYVDAISGVTITTPVAPLFGSTAALLAVNTTQNQCSGEVIVNAAQSTNIQIQFGYTSVGATPMQYSLNVTCEAF